MTITNKILILSLIFFAILYTVCTIFLNKSLTTGVLLGYVLAGFNFFMLSRKIKNAFEGKVFGAVAFGSQVRLFATGIIIWLAYERLHISMIGVLVGLSVIPLCIPPVAVFHYRTTKECGGSA